MTCSSQCSLFSQNCRSMLSDQALKMSNSRASLKMSLCISCGLPASGKTSYWRRFVFECCKSDPSVSRTAFLIIEYDTIIPEHWLSDIDTASATDVESVLDLKDGQAEIGVSWKSFRYQVLLVIRSLVQSLHSFGQKGLSQMSQPDGVNADIWKNISPHLLSLNSRWQDFEGLIIIIDDNMYFRSMRYECFKLARACCIGFCQVYFKCSVKEAISRNGKRTQEYQVPEAVISKMVGKLEPPDGENFAWETSSFIIEAARDSSIYDQPILQLLISSLSNPVQEQTRTNEEEVMKSRIQGSASLLHQGDLILRKCVSVWMAESKKCSSHRDMKCKAKEALTTKEKIMEQLKVDPLSFGVSDEWAIDYSSSDPASDFYKFISDAFFHRMRHLPT